MRCINRRKSPHPQRGGSTLELSHLVKQLLEGVVIELGREGGDQGLGLLSAVAAKRTWN